MMLTAAGKCAIAFRNSSCSLLKLTPLALMFCSNVLPGRMEGSGRMTIALSTMRKHFGAYRTALPYRSQVSHQSKANTEHEQFGRMPAFKGNPAKRLGVFT
jgi:hypothetical protein